jgi:hypothetical protein
MGIINPYSDLLPHFIQERHSKKKEDFPELWWLEFVLVVLQIILMI